MTDAFTAAGVTPAELRADGGAAAMDLLLELQATSSRLPVRRALELEATAKGVAMLAGLSVGLFHSLDQIAALWQAERTFEPHDPTASDATYANWLGAVDRA
jgi:glycerol kinase